MRMAGAEAPPWFSLALDNFKHRYAPEGAGEGWGLEVFITTLRPSALRHKGLWMEIMRAWVALEGIWTPFTRTNFRATAKPLKLK